MSDWNLTYNAFNPAEEKLREALCTLGNGFFFTRGAAPESRPDGTHYPATYIAATTGRWPVQGTSSSAARPGLEFQDLYPRVGRENHHSPARGDDAADGGPQRTQLNRGGSR